MSFRFEEKILFHISDYLKIRKFISNSGGIEIYPKRKISSIYFENLHNEMYLNSEEGCLPRKKIRIRTYPKDGNNLNFFFETKISSVEGRYKISKKLSKLNYENFLEKGFFDNLYGVCYPKLWVTYFREYYSISNQRITLDQNIVYNGFKSTRSARNNDDIILEIKSTDKMKKDFLDYNIPFQKLRISKYCEGFNKLFNKNESQRFEQVI